MMINFNNIRPKQLFNPKVKESLFVYNRNEVEDFIQTFNVQNNADLLYTISRCIRSPKLRNNVRIENIVEFIKTLGPEEIDRFEDFIKEFSETNPNMLWNMLHADDIKLYKTADKFYTWLSTIPESKVEDYIYRAVDNNRLHNDDIYNSLDLGTKVEILDGYIAISSSNLEALDKFRDRVLESNDCQYEHRIRQESGITVHSYIFNIENKASN